MDSSMLDSMGNMGGMDMSSDGMFRGTNSGLARLFWYLIAGVLGLFLLLRAISVSTVYHRQRLSRTRSITYPSKPRSLPSQIFATATAVVREITYPQPFLWEGRWLGWLSPPSLGRSLLFLFYTAVVMALLTHEVVIDDAYYWERIGFRAAWISVTQVPLVYFLAMKVNIIGFLSGTSFDRLNWLHRWVSRTLLITITIHGGFFIREWMRADFMQLELSMMPMVKYGLGAWAVLIWTLFSSLLPIRRIAYELFVLQHIAAAAVFLGLLWAHVPSYASYNIWLSIALLVFDRTARVAWLFYQNIGKSRESTKHFPIRIGYDAHLRSVSENLTVITLRDVSFTWKAGQFSYLWFPTIGLLESHPFTVSNLSTKVSGVNSTAEFVVRAHSGFTRRLHRHALRATHNGPGVSKVIAMGPFGYYPTWNTFETHILISASTGTSFTLPILETLIREPCCVQRIDFLLLVKTKSETDPYLDRLELAIDGAESSGISLRIWIAITGKNHQFDGHRLQSETASADPTVEKSCLAETYTSGIQHSQGRPNLAEHIRFPVEESGGETSVAVCGGKSLVASVRNCVASLSDERAVHKGTGAQGIHLHVEEYCF